MDQQYDPNGLPSRVQAQADRDAKQARQVRWRRRAPVARPTTEMDTVAGKSGNRPGARWRRDLTQMVTWYRGEMWTYIEYRRLRPLGPC